MDDVFSEDGEIRRDVNYCSGGGDRPFKPRR